MNPEQITEKKAISYAVKSGSDFQVKDVDLSKKIVTGFYNTALFFDSDYDVILPGANTKSINDRGPKSNATQKIKHLMDHEWNTAKMPGKIIALEEKSVEWNGRNVWGTYFEMKCVDDIVLMKYQEGVYDNHSEGFRYLSGEFVEEGSELWKKYLPMLINPQDAEKAGFMYLWSELGMYEGSTVAFGANSLTPYLGVKSMNKDSLLMVLNNKLDVFAKQLKNGSLTDESMMCLEMEALQIKQYMNEILSLQPSEKDTLVKQGRQAKDTKEEGLSNKLLNCF